MSTAQATFVATVMTAAQKLANDRAAAEMAKQSAIAAATYAVGKVPGAANFDSTATTAVSAAGTTALSSLATAEHNKQVSIDVARRVLKDAGEYGY